MYYYIYADKDATIYSEVDNDWYKRNTGIDEILELQKKTSPPYDVAQSENSRILVKFDLTEVSKSMEDNIIPTIDEGTSVSLKLFTARPSELPLSYSVEAYPISGSWGMGLGKKYYSPAIKDGVSWKYRTGETTGDEWLTSSFAVDSKSTRTPSMSQKICVFFSIILFLHIRILYHRIFRFA